MPKKVNYPAPPTKAPSGPPPPPAGGRSDTITLPVAFIRRVARMRSAQIHIPESSQAQELAKQVDEDLKVIAQMLQIQEVEFVIFPDKPGETFRTDPG